jgi:low density lipoprotein receptor-related protein 5/6
MNLHHGRMYISGGLLIVFAAPLAVAQTIYCLDSGRGLIRIDSDKGAVEELIPLGLGWVEQLDVDRAAAKLYWADKTTRKIQRSNLDGSEVEDIKFTHPSTPYAVAVDPVHGKLYWSEADFRGIAAFGRIMRADLNGDNVETVVPTAFNSVPNALALDLENAEMFWNDTQADSVNRATLDGDFRQTIAVGLRQLEGIVLDVVAHKVYWADCNSQKIQRANADGSQKEDFLAAPNFCPKGLAFDAVARQLYWSGAFGSSAPGNRIQRGSVDTLQIEDIGSDATQGPWGIALDIDRGMIFWADFHSLTIRRADLDGSNSEEVVTPGLRRARNLLLDAPRRRFRWIEGNAELAAIRSIDLKLGEMTSWTAPFLERAQGLVIDPHNDTVYWSDIGRKAIFRARINGANAEQVVSIAPRFAVDIALDIAHSDIYWAALWLDGSRIQRTNLSHIQIHDVITHPAGGITSLTVDPVFDKLYWTTVYPPSVQRADCDGSFVETLPIPDHVYPTGIHLDKVNEVLYWTDAEASLIRRASLDGTAVEDLGLIGLVTPGFLAVDSCFLDQTTHLETVTLLAKCLEGPGAFTTGQCHCADLSGDARIDLKDFDILQRVFQP